MCHPHSIKPPHLLGPCFPWCTFAEISTRHHLDFATPFIEGVSSEVYCGSRSCVIVAPRTVRRTSIGIDGEILSVSSRTALISKVGLPISNGLSLPLSSNVKDSKSFNDPLVSVSKSIVSPTSKVRFRSIASVTSCYLHCVDIRRHNTPRIALQSHYTLPSLL